MDDLFDLSSEDIEQLIKALPELNDKDVSKSFDKFLNSTTDF